MKRKIKKSQTANNEQQIEEKSIEQQIEEKSNEQPIEQKSIEQQIEEMSHDELKEFAKKLASKKQRNFKKIGVIASIASLLQNSPDGISKPEILAHLKEKFPERDEFGMRATISVQVPSRINNERFPIEKLANGKYRALQPAEESK